jgi:hypothetical protein
MKIVRYVLTALLLLLVWRHSHWSVALSITLIAVMEEIRNFTGMLANRTLASLINPSKEAMSKAINDAVKEAIPHPKMAATK